MLQKQLSLSVTSLLHRIYNSESPLLVAFSGGKDSVAMVLYLLEMGIAKERIHLHHHDVDGDGDRLFDWACTKSYCIAFAKAFDLPIYFSYRKGGILRAIYRNNEPKEDVYFQKIPNGPFLVASSNKSALNTCLKFPAASNNMSARWCSSTVKIDVLRTAIAHNDNYLGNIFILTGERREESINRSKYDEIEYHKVNTHSRNAIAWRPIINWSETDVWSIIRRNKVQPHPCYMLGWNRCSCQLCVFSSADIWATIARLNPEKIETISLIENDIKFTLYNGVTIKEKIDQGHFFENMDPLWVQQATGVFTMPILTKTWQLPKGAFRKETAGSV